MGSYPGHIPSGLRIFSIFPHGLLTRLLTTWHLSSADLTALSRAASALSYTFLESAIEAAAETRVRSHPNGKPLVSDKLPSESWLSLLRYIHTLDTAVEPAPATEIWSCGRNDCGQGARRGNDDVNILQRTSRLASDRLDFEQPPATVIQVAAGAQHSACITALGVLHVAGSNRRGQLGLRDLSARPTWTPVLDLKWARISQLACGASHTVLLTSDGHVLVTGANDYGQLGLPDAAETLQFTKPQLPPAVMVAAGNAHTVALLDDGSVWATGDNSAGQLGGRRDRGSTIFAQIGCFGRRVVRISSGADTTMLLTVDNMVLVTGKRQGGLSVIGGLGTSRVKHLSVGEGFAIAGTYENDAAVSAHRKRFFVTDELLDVSAKCVSAGISHYAIVTDEGAALAAGANAFGQVAAGEMGLTIQGGQNARLVRPLRVPLSPVNIPRGYHALQVAAGAFHTLYLLSRNEV